MSLLTKTFILVFALNIAISISGFTLAGDDVLSRFFTTDYNTNKMGVSSSLNATIPTDLSSGAIVAGNTGLSFIDVMKMIGNFVLLLLSSLIAPIYWGYILGVPIWLQMVLFMPLQLITLLGIIYLIRGSGGG